MNSVEIFLLDCGFSWTLSRLLPYIVFPLIGFLIWLLVRKRMDSMGAKLLVFVILVPGIFTAYFISNPIYEGDFANNAKTVAVLPELKKEKQTLVVVTIPGCPFCMESVHRMKSFKERNPKLNIEYRVCSADTDAITAYADIAKGAFPVVLATDRDALAKTAGLRFPAYVLTDGKSARRWSNNDFGVAALDEVEDAFN